MKLLLYCTRQPHKLFNTNKGFVLSDFELGDAFKNKTLLNGKIVAECDFEAEEYTISWSGITEKARITCKGYGKNRQVIEDNIKEILNKSCLSQEQIIKYLQLKSNFGTEMYAIHIKNLNIFDKPRELKDYSKRLPNGDFQVLGNAPQNMMKCCEIKYMVEDYILISIRPEWLCKILNGEKTIECRKRILKEMM